MAFLAQNLIYTINIWFNFVPGYRSSHSTTQNFFRRSTMVANIFEGFEPPSKKFLDTPLLYILFSIKESEVCNFAIDNTFFGGDKKIYWAYESKRLVQN